MDYSVTYPLENPHSEACSATFIWRYFSTSLSTRMINSWLITWAGRPGLGSSSKESHPRLNSADHCGIRWATITMHISHMPMGFFNVCILLSEELYDCSELNILTFHFCLWV